MNAYTIPISVADIGHSRDKMVTASANGLKYKKEAKAYVFIGVTKGIFFSGKFTNGEVAALVMHEVGHNFQSVISNPVSRTMRSINAILKWLIIPVLCLVNGPLRDKYMYLLKDIRNSVPGVIEAFDAVKIIVLSIAGIFVALGRILTNIATMLNPLGFLTKLPLKVISALSNNTNIFLPLSYRDEVVADNFSTAYGYGPELTSALAKSKQEAGGMLPDKMFRDSIFGPYFDLCSLPDKMIANLFDPHPNTIARLNDQYLMLEKELLDSELKPSMKNQIKKDMKEIEKTMEAFTDLEDSGYIFSNLMDKILLKFVKGDVRSFMSIGTASDFDRVNKELTEN